MSQARQGFAGGIGVQGGKHQVAGLSGFYCDLRRFPIADLTDHDDVRILSQQGA
ncbi:hypothetical protein D3C76_1794250 [compost metagenome]